MSNETAQQIEFLIETVQQDFELKSSLLEDVVEGEVLVAEQLQGIHSDVIEIKNGLFNFFDAERARFEIEQQINKEANFRLLERLKESRGGQFAPLGAPSAPVTTGSQQQEGGQGFFGSAGAAFAGAGLGVGAAAGRFAGTLARRVPQLAIVAGAITAGINYFAELEANLERFKQEGIDPETAMTEAATLAAGELAADFSDVVVEPIANFGLDVIAKEFGMIPEDVEEFRAQIDNMSEALRRGTISVTDSLATFFGDETVMAAQREDEQQLGELGQELAAAQEAVRESGLDAMPGGEIETGLARLDEISARQEEIRALPAPSTPEESRARAGEVGRLREEQRQLRTRLAPVLEEQRIQREIAAVQESSSLSQAGYAAGDLQTTGMSTFEGLPAEDKKQFFMDQVSPALKEAEAAGAIDVDLSEALTNFLNPLNIMSPGAVGVPLDGLDLEGLKGLTADQLEALLINDDILRNSTMQTGAMETSDRKIVEYLYRVKTGEITPSASPTLPDSPAAGGAVEPVRTASVSTVSEAVIPLPSVAGSSGNFVADASRNVSAQAQQPVVLVSNQGGDTVNTNVQNNSTTVLGGGARARNSDNAYNQYQASHSATHMLA